MPDLRARCCDVCSKPIAEADPVRVENGRAHHLGCWWRQRHRAEIDVVDATTARTRTLRIEAQQAVLAAQGQRARRFAAARTRRGGGNDPCVVCGEAIRTGAPGYRTEERRYHVACWERPTFLTSWLLLGAPHAGSRGSAPRQAGWENPRTPTGDPVCLLCGEAIEVAQPAVHLQGWLAHGLCWEPPLPLRWPEPGR